MPSTYTRNVLTLVSKHMEHQECPKLRRIVSFKIQLSRQCTWVHNDGRNIGKTDNRSCNCTCGEGLRVLRRCLLEPGTWRCPLFPVHPQSVGSIWKGATSVAEIHSCTWKYVRREWNCAAADCWWEFVWLQGGCTTWEFLNVFHMSQCVQVLWFLQLPERQGFTNCKQAAGCITIPYCMCKKYVLAHTSSKSILYSFDAPHLGATFLRTGHEKFIPILEADMEEKNK